VREPRRTPGAESSRKVLSLLAWFQPSRPAASIEMLSRAIRAPKSTTYRYVSLLREFGFLMESPRGKYSLGPRALGMARAAQAAVNHAELARPVMEVLAHDTGETIFLVRRVGDHAICIGRCDPVNPVRIFLEIGSAVPLHVGASPKILLAHLPARERDAYIARVVDRDPALRRNRARLCAELERMLAHGSGITIDEITPGVWACAAPIVEDAKVVAALSIAGPAFRIGKGQRSAFETMVKNAARQVSAIIDD
jgi:DNA-binding IclR family transcriptional regulator